MADIPSEELGVLGKIDHFVVLMLENRSFDHMLGALRAQNPAIAGGLDKEFSNATDPASSTSPVIDTGPADKFAMPFDPGHEFVDVQIQLYGRASSAARQPAARFDPAPMSGFVYSAENVAPDPGQAGMVMQYFPPERLRVLTSLATEFAIFNYWHAPLPGPTWPNRFFVHAATSGGLSDSPKDPDILAGYSFRSGTIYQRLQGARQDWRIYHDGLPQTAGIDSLRTEYLNVFTKNFRDMEYFEDDLKGESFPAYVFIEPNYDTGHQYVNGNSMHPLNDVRKGEELVKRVYEAIRASRYWGNTMLIVTFDEHGGFFDHVPPPLATPPGGDDPYSNPVNHFEFDRLGVRVPAIVVSAYTQRDTVVGVLPQESYDHTSILATVERRFALAPLTARDEAARVRTLEGALNLTAPRLAPAEAPLTLPAPVGDSLVTRVLDMFRSSVADATVRMSDNQRVQLTLAHACNLRILDAPGAAQAHRRYIAIRGQKDAADYIQDVEDRIRARRQRATI
jgi:phospholipase C